MLQDEKVSPRNNDMVAIPNLEPHHIVLKFTPIEGKRAAIHANWYAHCHSCPNRNVVEHSFKICPNVEGNSGVVQLLIKGNDGLFKLPIEGNDVVVQVLVEGKNCVLKVPIEHDPMVTVDPLNLKQVRTTHSSRASSKLPIKQLLDLKNGLGGHAMRVIEGKQIWNELGKWYSRKIIEETS
jgi:hypothetical protein